MPNNKKNGKNKGKKGSARGATNTIAVRLTPQVAARVRNANRKGQFTGPSMAATTNLAVALCQAQAVPRDTEAMRLPQFLNPQLTSVLDFTNTDDLKVSTLSPQYAALFRSPTRPLWFSKFVEKDTVASVRFSRAIVPVVPLPDNHGESVEFRPFMLADTSTSWSLVRAGADSAGFLPNYCPAVDATNTVWFYAPAGLLSQFRVFTDGDATGAEYELIVSQVDSLRHGCARSQQLLGYISASGTSILFDVVTAGWYAMDTIIFRSGSLTAPVGIANVSFGCCTGGELSAPTAALARQGPFWNPPAPTAEFLSAPTVWTKTRVTAVAALFTNTTAVVYKGGNCFAHRAVKSETYGKGIFNSSYFGTLLQSEYAGTTEKEKYSGNLAKGLYMFCKPDGASLDFRDWTFVATVDGVAKQIGCVRFDSTDYVDIARFDAASVSGMDVTEAGFLVTVSKHIEYIHQTQLWPLDIGRIPTNIWHQAQIAATDMPNHYENPIHLAAIAAMARAAAQWALPVVAPYARSAAMALAGKAYSAFTRKIQKKP